MVPILFMLAARAMQRFMGKGESGEAEEGQSPASERARLRCTRCHAEPTPGALYCHRCGGGEFTTLGEILDQQDAERQQLFGPESQVQGRAEQESLRRAYQEAARRRCRELLTLRYCTHCEVALDPAFEFCDTCGREAEPLPGRWALAYARQEFPELIRTEADFMEYARG